MPDTSVMIAFVFLFVVSVAIAVFIDRFYKTRVRGSDMDDSSVKK